MLRRAQATIFLIIAICIIAFAIYSTRPGIVPAQTNIPAQTLNDDLGLADQIQSCIGSKIQGVVDDFSEKGTLMPKKPLWADESYISVFETPEDVPTAENALEQIQMRAANRIKLCLEDASVEGAKGAEIPTVEAIGQEDSIYFKVHYPITIPEGGRQRTISEFEYKIQYPLSNYLADSIKIMEAATIRPPYINMTAILSLDSVFSIDSANDTVSSVRLARPGDPPTQYNFVIDTSKLLAAGGEENR